MSHGVLQTVRLIVEDGMEINAIEIVRSSGFPGGNYWYCPQFRG